MHTFRRLFVLAVVLLSLAPAFVPGAAAHGRTEVGDYQFVIGFKTEPAFQGEPNGLDLMVTNKTTNEPVLNLADSLKVELIYGASKRELEVRAQFGKDGAYTAYVLPTVAGDYTWHIWGTVESTPVDITMTSSDTTFHAVRPKSDVSFPEVEATTAELTSQIRTSTYIGIGGAILGLGGVGLGLAGLRARRGR
ncbi:MAG TPA: hypothetical protein VD886_15215 [Herpetosiphonaceae bacterium]|nr:hypothetical protein [Herpetosiphonaceae bacterium]